MKILLIAGHGAGDPGAVATHGNKTYKEAEETRALVKLVGAELNGYDGVTVVTYPSTRSAYKDAQSGEFVKHAGLKGCDYVLELHFNAFKKDAKNGKTKGVECYVTTKEVSTTVEDKICGNISALGFTNRIVKRKNFDVISKVKAAGVSSALLEVCFIDDPDDWDLYLKKQKQIAKAIADGIAEGFKLTKTKTEVKPKTATKTGTEPAGKKSANYSGAYKVTASALNMRAGAGKEHRILAVLPNGATVQCYGYYDTDKSGSVWLYVQAGGRTGYVSKDFVKKK